MARFGACILFVLCACSNDTFVGEDGSADAAADVGHESGGGDAIALEGGATSFCSLHSEAFFCDDWDDASETVPWSKWSTTTPPTPTGVIAFGSGVNSARGVTLKAAATSQTFLTRQTQGDALGGLAFDMKVENLTASATYVRVTAESKTFTLATDVSAGNLVLAGDSGGTTQLAAADKNWHHFVVTFANSSAAVSEDNGAHTAAVVFSPNAPTTSTLDVGIVASTLGGTVDFDDVLLR